MTLNHHTQAIWFDLGLGPLWQPLSSPHAAICTMPKHDGIAAESNKPTDPDLSNTEASWDLLDKTIKNCQQCALCQHRQQTVLGVGDRQARWLVVGEGPGAEEDRQGEPFVGPAGQLLDRILAALKLQRGQDVYIANAVKCRPPNNRTPLPEEIAACLPYLQQQIELIQPKIIMALGRPATQAILGGDPKIGAMREIVHRYMNIPVIVSYHPAYLLRKPEDKRKAWVDWQLANQVLSGSM